MNCLYELTTALVSNCINQHTFPKTTIKKITWYTITVLLGNSRFFNALILKGHKQNLHFCASVDSGNEKVDAANEKNIYEGQELVLFAGRKLDIFA